MSSTFHLPSTDRRPAGGYLPGIDGLRAIAVLAVIVFHVEFLGFLPGGFTGVDMFFVISGYVISQSLAERRHRALRDYLLDFYRRRALRILPALLVVLLVSVLVSALLVPPVWLSNHNADTGLTAFLGVSNFTLAWQSNTYFSPSAEFNPYLHTWSLAVEEQFYVIFPVLFFCWLRYHTTHLLARIALPLLTLASLAWCAMQTQAAPLSAFYLLPSRFWELAAGALLFQMLDNTTDARRRATWPLVLLGAGLGLLVAGFVWTPAREFPFPWALVTVAGTALAIAGIVLAGGGGGRAGVLHRVLSAWPVTYFGRLSYSLYLWHWPVAVFLRWTVGLETVLVQVLYPLVVLGLAAASYHWIEQPMRRGRRMLQCRAGLTISAALLAVGLSAGAAMWTVDNTERLSLSRVADSYVWHAYKHYPREPIEVVEDPALQGRQLFVLGDSHTAAYRTMLNIVSLRLGIEVVEYERGGCAVVSLLAADPAACGEWKNDALADIQARAKPGDVVFLASLRMPELAGRDGWKDEDVLFAQALGERTAQQAQAARTAADAVLAPLQAAGLTVLIDAPSPVFKAPANRCSDAFNRMNPICAPGLTVERDRLLQLRAPQMHLLTQLAREYPVLKIWDPLPILCPGHLCSAYDEKGDPLFADADHLSGHGNRVLEPSFTQFLINLYRPL
ncbi:acyltransferase family protein [Pseudomonas rhizosphaerae]|uniref:acyltransferase family protein n=1 Tax=Pseudomonas rhizosphaerae TaxID=216142 RepID=UPI000694935F|nr:acyltransferase family protein [Pseudomonas rhizosphaerae]MEB2870862.1 acyltransferase family protein [Pseudomonas rhizosphaerae]